MTNAFNLSQLANNVNSTGKLNAAAGLYNATPVANGGTNASALTANGALIMDSAGTTVTSVAAGTSGNVLTSNGTTWVSSTAGGAVPILNVYTTPGTWTKPATLKGIKVTVVAGGGAGGPSTTPHAIVSGGGGGGGGGAAIRIYPTPSLPGPQPYTVGGSASASSFGVAPVSVITATAGNTGGTQSGANPGIGSTGGVGSNGNLNINGGVGTPGNTGYASGSGGNSALGMGGGAAGVFGPIGTAGATGLLYGGGGSGAYSPGSGGNPTVNGGAGGAGVVIIEEFY